MYEIYSIGKTLEEHRKINSLSINGSFATIPFFSQMIADMFNKTVNLRKNHNSIALGTFLISATEMGIYKNLDEAARTVDLPDSFEPNPHANEVYSKYFSIFERLSTKLYDEFEEISTLQKAMAE
jgi:gluconokinase